MPNWTELVGLFASGSVPWITQIRRLKCHFELPSLDLAPIFNGFASVFGIAIFAYYAFQDPGHLPLLDKWWLFLVVAFVCSSLFLLLFFREREPVQQGKKKWPLYPSFFLYALFFCSLSGCFGSLSVLVDHLIAKGVVIDESSSEPLPSAQVDFELGDGEVRSDKTDLAGQFLVVIPNSVVDEVHTLLVTKQGYEEFSSPISGSIESNYSIQLSRIEN